MLLILNTLLNLFLKISCIALIFLMLINLPSDLPRRKKSENSKHSIWNLYTFSILLIVLVLINPFNVLPNLIELFWMPSYELYNVNDKYNYRVTATLLFIYNIFLTVLIVKFVKKYKGGK